MTLKQLLNEDDFKKFISDSSLSLVHFYASWAASCDQLNTVLVDLHEELENDSFKSAFIDAEGVPTVSLKCNITAAPTVVFFKNGQEVDRVNGFQPSDIRLKIAQHSVLFIAPHSKPKAHDEDLNSRLKRLINSQRLMLFMKGNPEQPRCGFSRQIIEMLSGVNAIFGSFDILEDEEVRQGLKVAGL
uniref:Glutaredoxin domain-containing protein n=1 Tax=Heterorhabditis bacteriophora TaxID=37862 RepID=A0A1I7XMA7_HETBA